MKKKKMYGRNEGMTVGNEDKSQNQMSIQGFGKKKMPIQMGGWVMQKRNVGKKGA